MSNWSSFEKDKEYTDAWREYISENEDGEIEIDEGLWDQLKTAGKAGMAAFRGHDIGTQFKKGAKARAATADSASRVATASTTRPIRIGSPRR